MGTNTGLGIGIGIPFKNNALGGDKPYFPPELKARMIGVWTNYGKKNTDADRNIIKNKIPNAGGDLEILNSAYKLNSGFGEYREDFTSWIVSKEPMTVEKTDSQVHISYIGTFYKELPMFEYSGPINKNYSLTVEIQGIPNNVIGKFIHNNGFTQEVTNGINTIKFSNSGSWYGFTFYREDNTIIGDCNITIKQIPAFEGALVTDGINDIIASIKTLEDWNIGNKGITIVSMIHQINTNTNNFITTNNIRTDNKVIGRNIVSNIEKTGIYGWYKENIQSDTINVINNILGDKNDYTSHSGPSTNINPINNSKFYVQGYAIENGFAELSSVAHYWTFAVLGKATEDEINLIIAKYNLDRTLRPDILCNITKQGITNDNHADFNDKLIDYSGNGRDIQMNNLAWKGGSGIAAKKFETIKDYSIIPDEGLQELTIYNEFSFKIKSIRYADRYWAVQSLNKTDMSYPVTIITDKDIIWRNVLNYTDADGVKGSVKKETNVPANTPTQVFIYGFNDFDISDDYTKVNCVAYATRKDITEFTVTFIPSCKGGLLLDGINDFGKVTGMPIYKDYTVVADREIDGLAKNADGGVALKGSRYLTGAFCFDYKDAVFSFGTPKRIPLDTKRFISYQSKYVSNGISTNIGRATDNDELWIGRLGNDERYSKIAIRFLMSFSYSMSEFLIERQLKKHKLGTLYPDMVEFRPVIKANANYKITYYQIDSTNTWKSIKVGDYIVIGAKLAFQITFDNDASELKEVVSPQLSGIIVEKRPSNPGYNIYSYITSKSPQKINITIDEYIRFEDIVQPYPVLLRFNDENGNEVSWGGKFRVGSTITRIGSIADPESNLLNGLYSISGLSLNGKSVTSSTSIVEKQMVFTCTATYLLDDNEPKCILSPSRLRIPNSSYKLLGYIPDISGHGNHGIIHNSAYAEGSGVNEDGSYQFDGVDDFVAIPTLSSGGKQVLMKVNWQKEDTMIYNQNPGEDNFAIYANDYNNNNLVNAYASRNNGSTYIDGILNNNILATQLKDVTHNITITNENVIDNTIIPVIGANAAHNNFYAQMSLYDFMLFDKISTDDKILELNEYVGIEAKVELPPYYWDAYGKTNLDGDKAAIQQRGVAVGDYDLTNSNFAYDKMSGFGGYTLGKFTNSWSLSNNGNSNSISIVARNPYDITLKKLGGNSDWEFNTTELKIISNPVSVKFKSDKNIRFKCDYHYYTVGGNSEGTHLGITSKDLIANEDTIITISPISQENIDKYNIDINRGYYLIYFQLSPTLEVNEEVTIEMLPLYPNGLVYDGITDYSKNANIPALTDFTVIAKRVWMNKDNPMNECFIHKGVVSTPIRESAFMLEYEIANDTYYRSSSYGGYINIERSNRPERIVYQTSNSYNGTSITKGSGADTTGIVIGGVTNNYWNGVFYKLMLYSKTLPLLQINYLKNLMERDEIIDLNNKIFIQE